MIGRFYGKMTLVFFCSFGISFATGASDFVPILNNLANGLNSMRSSEQAAESSDSQSNSPLAAAAAQSAQAASQNVYAFPTQNFGSTGYPILDPYQKNWDARTSHWQAMANAQLSVQKGNEEANRALEAERTQTDQMLKIVGSTLETAGDQMTKIGEEKAKEAEEAAKKERDEAVAACSSQSCSVILSDGKYYLDRGSEPAIEISQSEFDNIDGANGSNASIQKLEELQDANNAEGPKVERLPDGRWEIEGERYTDPREAFAAAQRRQQQIQDVKDTRERLDLAISQGLSDEYKESVERAINDERIARANRLLDDAMSIPRVSEEQDNQSGSLGSGSPNPNRD